MLRVTWKHNKFRGARANSFLLCAAAVFSCSGTPPAKPNVVILLVDDLGWTDLGTYGSTFYETPNVDRLASEGIKFTQFYSAGTNCSPTRASIMTGVSPARLSITNWIGGRQKGKLLPADNAEQLPAETYSLGEIFSDAGYMTGYIGKWHLGDTLSFPEHHGFQFNLATNRGGTPGAYFYPYRNARRPELNIPDLENGSEWEYLTERLTSEAIEFLRVYRDQPFLLILGYYTVHSPIVAQENKIEKYSQKASRLPALHGHEFDEEKNGTLNKLRQDHPTYAGMIESMDESVGRIDHLLKELGLADNTIVVFLSDNGGLSTLVGGRTWMPTSNLPLRAGKAWLYEGGIRIPFIMRWPNRIPQGDVSHERGITTDLLPTLLDMTGLGLRPDLHIDGESLWSVVRENKSLDRETLFWHFPHYSGSGALPGSAIRRGDNKLVWWYENNAIELYDLKHDLGEQHNLAEKDPELATNLKAQLESWLEVVDAQMTAPNPDWKGGK
ncbi:MAG: sulfatase [Candidatus Neomarinimicrobiota bacterium]|nr:sulfatase [Candidatus Neomarinimicrobiota bacterium]